MVRAEDRIEEQRNIDKRCRKKTREERNADENRLAFEFSVVQDDLVNHAEPPEKGEKWKRIWMKEEKRGRGEGSEDRGLQFFRCDRPRTQDERHDKEREREDHVRAAKERRRDGEFRHRIRRSVACGGPGVADAEPDRVEPAHADAAERENRSEARFRIRPCDGSA